MERIKSQEFVLEASSELRIETLKLCTIQLKSGFAEIFGTELSKNKEYTFNNGGKFAVFTWHGATILMTGNTEDAYTSKETPMNFYLNIHTALEQMRCKAEEGHDVRGPRVLVVGPDDVGKTTLCKMLLNWAVRVGRSPVFVDLDVSQNSISLPGTISALIVERTAHVEDGFNLEAQIAYHFGYKTPNENPELYKRLITALTDTINLRSEKIHATLVSGIIINTCGWIRQEGYESILHAAREFDVNMVLVIDQERLCVDLSRDLSGIKVLLLPKSGGVVTKSQDIRTTTKNDRIREYFYGNLKQSLDPHNVVIKYSDIKLYKIGAPNLPSSCMPIGFSENNYTKVLKEPLSLNLRNHLLSISHAQDVNDDDESYIIDTNIVGYLVVTEVDIEKGTFKVMSPQPKPLPNTILLYSEVQFVDLR